MGFNASRDYPHQAHLMPEPPPKKQRVTTDPAPGTHLYKCKYILEGHGKPVTAAKFSPNGQLLATSCMCDYPFLHLALELTRSDSGRHDGTHLGRADGRASVNIGRPPRGCVGYLLGARLADAGVGQ